MKLNYEKGFTLVELSIVLVIIGLLVGGVLQGRELIEAAERRALISDVRAYEVALNTFKLQYDAVPGDMDEAEEYWPTEAQNGDGNGLLDTDDEIEDLWKQLGLSELIEGSYTGASSAAASNVVAGEDVPETPLGGGYVIIKHANNAQNVAHTPASKTNVNILIIGVGTNGPSGETSSYRGGALTTKESIFLDKKLDDGVPSSGRIRGRSAGPFNVIGNCTDQTPNNFTSVASYKLTLDSEECQLYYFYE